MHKFIARTEFLHTSHEATCETRRSLALEEDNVTTRDPAASRGISCGEPSRAHPIHYRILGLILPSWSVFHLNNIDKLFLNL